MDQFLKDVEELVVGSGDKDREDDIHPYAHLEKSKVLQDARIFHDDKLVRENPRKCCTIIAQILYLQNNAEQSTSSSSPFTLTPAEATELFFSATKLFVSSDACLRRIVYLFIKEVQPLCDPSDVIIVTSCLTKDMTCDVDLYRANALRVLVNVIDSAMLGAIERYIKQAIVDNNENVSNSALVAASHLFEQSTDNAAIVRRWISEVQEALSKRSRGTRNDMVQMNAMRLLCQMKGHDRLGMSKLVQQYSGQAGKSIKSPLALVILIRACGKLMREEMSLSGDIADHRDIRDISTICNLGFEFLESSLSHSSSMVAYDAARTICMLPNLENQPQNLARAIDYLNRMLDSEEPTERFAAVRTLAEVANRHPRAVARCNEGLEGVLEDSNTHIATMAITTLLKTGSEESIERLVKNISMLIITTPDEYKITIVKSLQRLCLTYPSKHLVIVSFLAEFLREEGGFEFKRSIITSIISLMRIVPETAESTLNHLCEFIEDCEYTELSTKTIHVIAELGPMTSAPSRYIRFLYNRVILENAMIRAAAVTALAKFATSCPSLRESIVSLLKRSRWDEDDEVRDRAVTAARVLEQAIEQNPYVAPDWDLPMEEIPPDVPAEGDLAMMVYGRPMPMSFQKLEQSIKAYIATPGAMSDTSNALTFAELPIIEDASENNGADIIDSAMSETTQLNSDDAPMDAVKPKSKERHDPAAAVYAIPELASLGRVFRSSAPIPLTEDETEYVVRCIKHILDNHVVLQFIIQNTVEDMRMDDVVVSIENDSELYDIIGDVHAEKIKCGATANCFTVLQRNADVSIEPVGFACQLNFTAVQVEPGTYEPLADGYNEEYPLEDLVITASDFMAKVPVADFRRAWNETNDHNEVLEKLSLQFKDITKAVPAVIDYLGMQPCDGTGQLPRDSSGVTQHMLHLSGTYIGGCEVLVRAQLSMQSEGVLLKIAVRSDDHAVSQFVANCIR